jgi:hypothetical protein
LGVRCVLAEGAGEGEAGEDSGDVA